MDLDQIKSSWNEVLDSLLDQNRVAWIAFFHTQSLISAIKSVLGISPTIIER